MGFPKGIKIVEKDVFLLNCFFPTNWITFSEERKERKKERLIIRNIQPKYEVQTTKRA